MEKFYEEVERFVKELETGNAPDASRRAVQAHKILDTYVKRLQVVKEFLEIINDERLLLADRENNPFPALYDRTFTRDLLRGLDRIEEHIEAGRCREAGGCESDLDLMKDLLDTHIDRFYKLGDALRNTDALGRRMGG